MQRIEPVIRHYAWGSREALAKLGGRREPASEPEAELWVGAHEGDPCLVLDAGMTLDEHIAADPNFALGEAGPAFGERLPFLLKILAAEKTLSIQAHPSAERAAAAPAGTYGDGWPKPEAWVPLEECEAFIGSLSFDDAAERLRLLQVAELDDLVASSREAEHPALALLSGLLRWPAQAQDQLVARVVRAIRAALHSPGLDADTREAWSCVLRVHEQFPGDIGVAVLLTMEYRKLFPGVSCFLAAGVLHTFVRGTAVEILANSDNVVRAGLTPKAIDVEELLTIVDFEAHVTPERAHISGPLRTYACGAEHFALQELVFDAQAQAAMPGDGVPRIVLALGPVTLHCQGASLSLKSLQAAWIAAGEPAVSVTGSNGSRAFIATPGDFTRRRS